MYILYKLLFLVMIWWDDLNECGGEEGREGK